MPILIIIMLSNIGMIFTFIIYVEITSWKPLTCFHVRKYFFDPPPSAQTLPMVTHEYDGIIF